MPEKNKPAITLVITKAGRAAIINGSQTGTQARVVVSLGVTATAFTPSENMTSLPDEVKRITTIGGNVQDRDTINLVVKDEGSDVYTVRGMGLYLDDGTLFAVYGQSEPIFQKSSLSMVHLRTDIKVIDASISAQDITFGDIILVTPQASQTEAGIARIATLDEVLAGELDGNAFVTPATLEKVLQLRGIPIGTILPVSIKRLPPGWIRGNGGLRNVADYPLYFNEVGYDYGGSGDRFGIPEIRGDALRFLDDGRGVDPNRILGSEQGDASRRIYGNALTLRYGTLLSGEVGGPFQIKDSGHGAEISNNSNLRAGHSLTFDSANQTPTAAENRMRNVAFYGIIYAYHPRSI